MKEVGSIAQTALEGMSQLPGAVAKAVSSPWTWIGVAAIAALAGGALLIHYVPRAPPRRQEA